MEGRCGQVYQDLRRDTGSGLSIIEKPNLLSDRSGVVTGSVIDWDQNVLGCYD